MKVRFYVDIPQGYVVQGHVFTATTLPIAGVLSHVAKRVAFDVELPVQEYDAFVVDLNGVKAKEEK